MSHKFPKIIIFIALVVFFFVFAYNSGYGYDALEYLIIARSMQAKHEIYDFIPSKSWLLYVFIRHAIDMLGGVYNHVSVTTLITILFTGIYLSMYSVVQHIYNHSIAIYSACLVALCCVFMEMNFLEPEAPIAILALISYYFLQQHSLQKWLLGGIFLGIAMCFKSIALFYVMGAFLFLLWELLSHRLTFRECFIKGLAMSSGFILILGLSAIYFYAIGKLSEHLEWSYSYPFAGYPAHTLFLTKLLKKTSWFIVLLASCLGASIGIPRLRKEVYEQSSLRLALCLALCSLIALLKAQPSHYFFPAAVFFCIFIGYILYATVIIFEVNTKQIGLLTIGFIALLTISIQAYRPDSLKRLYSFKDYSTEEKVAIALNSYLKPTEKALIIDNSTWLYFIGNCLPNVPFINTEMQTTHYIGQNPFTYQTALADTTLNLVIFGNSKQLIDDSTQINSPTNQVAIQLLRKGLEQYFVPKKNTNLNLTIWLRK